MRPALPTLLVAALVACASTGAPEAGPDAMVVTGRIVDQRGLPVASATVRVDEAGAYATTSTDGSFVLRIPAHRVREGAEVELVAQHPGREREIVRLVMRGGTLVTLALTLRR
jgi:hypothetical protein